MLYLPRGKKADDLIFALDIGTHSVVGVLGKADNGDFVVVDYERVMHKAQVMQDGQIEDINQVAATVRQVKKALEKRNNLKCKQVAIAAAGRSLKTMRGNFIQEIDENTEITQPLIQSLEYSALSSAQEKFLNQAPDDTAQDFYCVGYSVTYYKLDDYAFANLLGHQGNKIEVEVIAAFLPHHVVRSLYAVTDLNGLEVINLTMEPTAAISVIVPKDIRLLNIAIVDIGAGTSDIAISKNGSIVAYGMITTAGNEVNEEIMRAFLVDYAMAETIKIAWANGQKEIRYYDILGNDKATSCDEVKKACEKIVDTLSAEIANTILQVNETAPVAVFVVGGGSQVPGLCGVIAEKLNLPEDRVAVGGKREFKNIICPDEMLGPEFVTPLGIGVVGLFYKGCNFFSVEVNGKKIVMLDYGKMKVFDALLMAGIKPAKLIGISAPALHYTVNGERKTKRGEPPVPGNVLIGDRQATIDDEIFPGDKVTALSAKNGVAPVVTIQDLNEDFGPVFIMLDGEETALNAQFTVGGTVVDESYQIKTGDEVVVHYPKTAKEIAEVFGKKTQGFFVYINGGQCSWDSEVTFGDRVEFRKAPAGQETAVPMQNPQPQANGEAAAEMQIFLNDTPVKLPKKENESYIMVDMLNFVEIDPEKPQGNLILQINGKDAAYTAQIQESDRVDIYWSEGKVLKNI